MEKEQNDEIKSIKNVESEEQVKVSKKNFWRSVVKPALLNFKINPVLLAFAVLFSIAATFALTYMTAYGTFGNTDNTVENLKNHNFPYAVVSKYQITESDINRLKTSFTKNRYYPIGYSNGSFIIIDDVRDVEKLGFRLSENSVALSSDSVYVSDLYAEALLATGRNFSRREGSDYERINAVEEFVGSIYCEGEFLLSVAGVVLTGQTGFCQKSAYEQAKAQENRAFYQNALPNVFCWKSYFYEKWAKSSDEPYYSRILVRVQDYQELSRLVGEYGEEALGAKYTLDPFYEGDSWLSSVTNALVGACIAIPIAFILMLLYVWSVGTRTKDERLSLYARGGRKCDAFAVYAIQFAVVALVTVLLSAAISLPLVSVIGKKVASSYGLIKGAALIRNYAGVWAEAFLVPLALTILPAAICAIGFAIKKEGGKKENEPSEAADKVEEIAETRKKSGKGFWRLFVKPAFLNFKINPVLLGFAALCCAVATLSLAFTTAFARFDHAMNTVETLKKQKFPCAVLYRNDSIPSYGMDWRRISKEELLDLSSTFAKNDYYPIAQIPNGMGIIIESATDVEKMGLRLSENSVALSDDSVYVTDLYVKSLLDSGANYFHKGEKFDKIIRTVEDFVGDVYHDGHLFLKVAGVVLTGQAGYDQKKSYDRSKKSAIQDFYQRNLTCVLFTETYFSEESRASGWENNYKEIFVSIHDYDELGAVLRRDSRYLLQSPYKIFRYPYEVEYWSDGFITSVCVTCFTIPLAFMLMLLYVWSVGTRTKDDRLSLYARGGRKRDAFAVYALQFAAVALVTVLLSAVISLPLLPVTGSLFVSEYGLVEGCVLVRYSAAVWAEAFLAPLALTVIPAAICAIGFAIKKEGGKKENEVTETAD
ncbi:MAG: hypothetical protein K5753_01420 [Clostridia bacterium]|nr:hypothetical protein [Clostridia bacterium]